MVTLTARLMYQAEFLLSRSEEIEVMFSRGNVSHACKLTGRGTGSDAQNCRLVCIANGRGAVVGFEDVLLGTELAARLERMAADADAILLDRRHRAHVAKGREFWAGQRKSA